MTTIKASYLPLRRPYSLLPGRRKARLNHASPAEKYGWDFSGQSKWRSEDVKEIPLEAIRRPLQGTRTNDGEKVQALVESIQEVGQKVPVDVLEVDGVYYGFSGCHRFEAMQRLEKPTILAKVRKANKQILKMHFM